MQEPHSNHLHAHSRTLLSMTVTLLLTFASNTFAFSPETQGLYAVSAGDLVLEFEKAAVSDTVWVGSVGGAFEGVLTTVLISADTSAAVWLVDFYWIVTAADPAMSFVARLAGTLDTDTGHVTMSGSVVEGFRLGVMVEEAARLVDAESSAFQGTIVLQAP